MRKQYYRTTPSGGLFSSVGRLVAAVFALLVFLIFVLRLAAPGLLARLATPLWQAGDALAGAAAVAIPLESRAGLLEDRERLARENEALLNQNAALAARVTDLERLLGGRTEAPGGILAGVLARPPVSPYDVLILDRGAEAGIAEGDRVLGPGGAPVGIITQTGTGSARATLYSEPGRITEAWLGAERIPVRLVGASAGAFDAELPGTAGALVGDGVYVPGPGALPLGIVSAVITDPSSPTVTLRIRPAANPFSLTWVTIVPGL